MLAVVVVVVVVESVAAVAAVERVNAESDGHAAAVDVDVEREMLVT